MEENNFGEFGSLDVPAQEQQQPAGGTAHLQQQQQANRTTSKPPKLNLDQASIQLGTHPYPVLGFSGFHILSPSVRKFDFFPVMIQCSKGYVGLDHTSVSRVFCPLTHHALDPCPMDMECPDKHIM